jgi:hypothetical protein
VLPEKLALAEGDTVTVTIHEEPTPDEDARRAEVVRRARGMWEGEAFIRHIRERRLVGTRVMLQA